MVTRAKASKRVRALVTEAIELIDPALAAKNAGLRHVSDRTAGITRRMTAKGPVYKNPDGMAVKDKTTLQRIRQLVIPPAWTDVWICPTANGHLQATGRDARGRKQYKYHTGWRTTRDETKYTRMIPFGEALPALRKRVSADLALAGLSRRKVLATVVRLLEKTLVRVGNEEYARTNGSFGLTTMRDKHVAVQGDTLQFEFRGKSGRFHRIKVSDRRLARIVGKCRDLPGYELFQYLDEDQTRQVIDSSDINAYLREITEQDFTAKDFRTWAGTVQAAMLLAKCGPAPSVTKGKRNVVRAIEEVSQQLGNTPAICRKCYIHPMIIECYLENGLPCSLATPARDSAAAKDELDSAERAVLNLLQNWLVKQAG